VDYKPAIEVWTNRVVGYQTSIGRSDFDFSGRWRNEIDRSVNSDHTGDLFLLNLQLQKAQEMGFERLFLKVKMPILRAMASISRPPGMELVVELTNLAQYEDLQTCQEMIAMWRAQGIQFAVDDFGAGMIALPMIARLKPDYITVDFSKMVRFVPYEELQSMTNSLFPVLKSFAQKALVYIP
jgi:EAL domain-containing protein (putative c-di-GMP-specific phosphodiesterase class I)